MKKYSENSIFELCPNMSGMSLLYVGMMNLLDTPHKKYQKWFYDLFEPKGFKDFVVLEVWKDNVEFAWEYFLNQGIDIDVMEGDVLDASNIFNENRFDVSIWWHGPEHVKDIDKALRELERVTKKYIVIGCPNGRRKQNEKGGNPYEEHLSNPNEEFFKARGYLTKVVKRRWIGHLTAIKELK